MRNLILWVGLICLYGCQAAKPSPGPQAVARGEASFLQHCASCHSAAQNSPSGSLHDEVWAYASTDEDILKIINEGLDEVGMPAFGESLDLQTQKDILAYIRFGDAPRVVIDPITDVPSVEDKVQVEDYVTNLNEPWGFAFFPDQSHSLLITEKTGRLLLFKDQQPHPISGTPEVVSAGQGGLFDVAFDPDYVLSGWIYLALAHPLKPGSPEAMTKIIRGKLDGTDWVNEETLFESEPEFYTKRHHHYGGRITFDHEGYLYFSIGDRGKKDEAQNIARPNGKIHRIHKDGRVPEDNPFVGDPDAYPTIWSYGNRNPQGLVFHPESERLWETEHGPRGGDELNIIRRGVNYGWPKISYGINYSGTVLTPYTSLPGMAQPISQWTPSIAVCGLDVYMGDLFPEWKGWLMAGALRHQAVRLISIDMDSYENEVTLIKDQGRVRDVTTGPDGAIYVALPDRIVRLSPKKP